jgi:hypothetical protein
MKLSTPPACGQEQPEMAALKCSGQKASAALTVFPQRLK